MRRGGRGGVTRKCRRRLDNYSEKKTRYNKVGRVGKRGRGGVIDSMKEGTRKCRRRDDSYREKKIRYSKVGQGGERGRVMDSMKKDNKEMQETIGQLQKEKDQVQ